jgi:hypothetical protein
MEGLLLCLAALTLGAAALGPLLAALAPPMTALALNGLIMSLFLCGPLAPAPGGGAPLASSLAPLLGAGALFPLALRVAVSRQDFLAYSLGRANFWLAAGFFAGLILTAGFSGGLPPGRVEAVAGGLALFSAFLAAGPSLSWIVAAVLTAGVVFVYYMF